VIRVAGLLSAALWWGSLSTIGFVVVPLLFNRMQTRQMAGQMAALIFQYQAYVSWACAGVLILIALKQTRKAGKSFSISENSLLLVGLVFSLCVYFIVAPQISSRQNLKLWHSWGQRFLRASGYAPQLYCGARIRLSYAEGIKV
jgi:cytochrome c oxidase assembly factor CtaG